MALISDVSCMTWMTLRIITILLDAEGSFYEKDTLHLTVDYKDKHIRTGTDLYVNLIWTSILYFHVYIKIGGNNKTWVWME